MGDLTLRLGLLLAVLLGAASPAAAQVESASELQIKAAFLYQFGGFVQWPPHAFPDAQSPFVIGLLGADAMAADLSQIVANRTIQGRQVAVHRLRPGDPLSELHVLFVGRSEAPRLPEIVSGAKDAPLLMVTDFEGALSKGSMINFVAIDNKVRFDVALPQAERSLLKISSRLLGVARRVLRGRG